MPHDSYTPAKKSLLLAASAVFLAAILLFTLCLRNTMRSVTKLDAAAYTLSAPNGFEYNCVPTVGGGALTLRGWALVRGEGFQTVDCKVVLYNAADNQYLSLPTMMEIDETPTEIFNDGTYYGRGGFASVTPLKQLPAPLATYEICFAYRSNGTHNNLVHTGQMLEEQSL